jgi:hypothetical protein
MRVDSRSRRRVSLTLVLVVALLASSCGGGASQPGGAGAPGGTAADDGFDVDDAIDQLLDDVFGGGGGGGGGRGEQEDTTPLQTSPVNLTVWNYGFEIEIIDAELSQQRRTGAGVLVHTLKVNARFTNQSTDPGHLRGGVFTVAQGGNAYVLDGSGSSLPQVPGGLSTTGHLQFTVQDPFDLNSATLLIGGGPDNEARVPLGPQGGDLVDLAPFDVAASGMIETTLVDLVITGVLVRADTPHNHSSLAAGERTVYVHFDGVSRRQGNWRLFHESFTLILPNGNAVPVAGSDIHSMSGPGDGWSGFGPLDEDVEGTTTSGMYVRFLVPTPTAGEYTLRYRTTERWATFDQPEEGTFTFSIDR